MPNKSTTITVSDETKEFLDKERGDKSWDSFLRELYEKAKRAEEEILEIPEDIPLEDILDSIDEVEPPTKYKSILIWFLLALAGGWGLGVWLLK